MEVSVKCLIWICIHELGRQVDGSSDFRTKIILGTVLVWFWFSVLEFRDDPGTVPDCARTCGFRINSSNLNRGPRIRLFVLLKSWYSLFVTLLSIVSDTWVIYSSILLGTVVFRDCRFLGCSSWLSLATAANFLLFLSAAILKGKNDRTVFKTELLFNFSIPTWQKQKWVKSTVSSKKNTTTNNQYS